MIVLFLAEEVSPLWEIIDDFEYIGAFTPVLPNEAFPPNRSEEERIRLAAQAVSHLLSQNAIELVWTRWTSAETEWSLVDPSDHARVLEELSWWRLRDRYQRYIEIHATPS